MFVLHNYPLYLNETFKYRNVDPDYEEKPKREELSRNHGVL